MQTDSDNKIHTLETDIIDLWREHGWEVEEVSLISPHVWMVKATKIKKAQPPGD